MFIEFIQEALVIQMIFTSNLTMPSIPEPGSIQGATALKLEEEISTNPIEDLISGISLENASFVENNLNQDQIQDRA